MAIKPLPVKAQKFGRKLTLILSIVFGVLFAGCLGGFIGAACSVKRDQIVDPDNSSATSIKDVGDGLIYSTTDCHLVYCDYDRNIISDTPCKEVLKQDENTIGTLTSLSSLSYNFDTKELFVTGDFILNGKTNTYLFEFIKDENDGFKYCIEKKFCSLANKITVFTVHGDYLYALIRSGTKYCTINKINKTDLTTPIETAYLYEKYINFDDYSGDPTGVNYELAVNDVVYGLHYGNDNRVYAVSNKGIYAINSNKFNNYSNDLKDTYDFSSSHIEDSSKGMVYEDYLYFLFEDSGNSPRGLFEVENDCYFLTERQSMAHFNYEELDIEIPSDGSDLCVYEDKISTIEFNESFPSNRNALFYTENCKRGAVISDLGNVITLVNFENPNKPYIEFTEEADINISDAVVTNNGSLIYYLFQNKQITKDTLTKTIKVKDVAAVSYNIKLGKIMPPLLSCSIVFLLLTVLSILCTSLPMFLEKLIMFFKNVKQNWVTYVILAICLTLLGLFCYYPAVGSISMSFFNYKDNEPIVWNNFENYKMIFTDPKILTSMGNMAIFLVTDIITAIIPPLIFAFFLSVMKSKKMSAITRTLLFLPSVIPGITKMMIWQNGIYGEYGVINKIIDLFSGKPVSFFNGSNFDIWALILMGFPYVGSYLVFYGALMNIPSSYYEAAELEGLNVWKRFVSIDIPLIQPQIKYVVILTIIASVQNFGRTYMINSSLFTVKTPIHIMYDYINKGNYGLSSAIATILFVLLLVFTIFNLRKQKEQLGDSI